VALSTSRFPLRRILLATGLAMLAQSASAQNEPDGDFLSDQEFAQCKQQLQARAVKAGVSEAVASEVMAGAE